jgi:hypothetical protein
MRESYFELEPESSAWSDLRMSELVLRDPDLTPADKLERLIHKRRLLDIQELMFSIEAAEFAASDEYDTQGFASPIDCLRVSCHMTRPAVADRISVGERASELGQSIEAMFAGELGFAHLVVMARTADALGPAFDESQLLTKALENTPGKLHHLCRHYRHAKDAQGSPLRRPS